MRPRLSRLVDDGRAFRLRPAESLVVVVTLARRHETSSIRGRDALCAPDLKGIRAMHPPTRLVSFAPAYEHYDGRGSRPTRGPRVQVRFSRTVGTGRSRRDDLRGRAGSPADAEDPRRSRRPDYVD